jgi:hypothetical protein
MSHLKLRDDGILGPGRHQNRLKSTQREHRDRRFVRLFIHVAS